MTQYRIEYESNVKKSLEKLPKRDKLAILAKVELLATSPRPEGSKCLKGKFDDFHRIRVGDYRVIYHIFDQKLIILVVKVAHRSDVYR